jgi:hypothetical protein
VICLTIPVQQAEQVLLLPPCPAVSISSNFVIRATGVASANLSQYGPIPSIETPGSPLSRPTAVPSSMLRSAAWKSVKLSSVELLLRPLSLSWPNAAWGDSRRAACHSRTASKTFSSQSPCRGQATRVRCVSIFLDKKSRRYIGKISVRTAASTDAAPATDVPSTSRTLA